MLVCRGIQRGGARPAVPGSASVRLRRRRRVPGRLQRHVRRADGRVRRLRQDAARTRRRLVPHRQDHRLPTGAQPHTTADLRCVAALPTIAAVLVSQAEAIIRSLTNMAAAGSNGYLVK